MPIDGAHIRKLHALKERIDKTLAQNPHDLLIDPLDAQPLFERWAALHGAMLAQDEELADLPKPALATVLQGHRSAYDGRGGYEEDQVRRLQRDVQEVWTIVTHPSKQLAQVSLGREGIFLAGQPFDAMMAVTSIVQDAKKSVVVIDGYIDERRAGLHTRHQGARNKLGRFGAGNQHRANHQIGIEHFFFNIGAIGHQRRNVAPQHVAHIA